MAAEQTEGAALTIDTTKAHPARMYNYFLGGKDNFAADREAAEKVLAAWGTARSAARENRAFLGRAVHFLVREAGIRQFLDIGTGLPSANNVHDVAQRVAPESRVVYVDNDPIVLAHARALLTSTREGRTAYVHADLREPERILHDPATRDVLDFSQPIALMLVAILHFVPDEDEPTRILATLRDALPPGSYLTASSVTSDHAGETLNQAGQPYAAAGIRGALRTVDEFTEMAFTGMELVHPGVVLVSEWRPTGDGPRPLPPEINIYAGMARKV